VKLAVPQQLAVAAVFLLSAAAMPAQDALDLSPYRGKVVLVDFWASWCGPCAESFPWMTEMIQKHGAEGLVVVAVGLDQDREAGARFLAGRDARIQNVSDPTGAIAEAWGIDVMPSSILFDRNGHATNVHKGFRLERTTEYEAHIVALLQGTAAVTPAAAPSAPTGKRRLGVRPWQRGILSQQDMRLDCDPLDLATDDHIYFSKEASSGGRSFGGGGCGCN
jgi:cytochrome c biogenesis protein CcmG/thiol:disulfide interchange protein DsbE